MTAILDPNTLSDSQQDNFAHLLYQYITNQCGTPTPNIPEKEVEMMIVNFLQSKFKAKYNHDDATLIFDSINDLNWFILSI